MLVKKSYKFRLSLTPEQQVQCARYAGCCRFVWNKSLALKKEAWEKEKKSISQYELNDMLVQWKQEFPWLQEAPSQALQQVNKNLDQAYKNFFKHAEYPKFKKKGVHDSFRLPQGFKLLPDLNHKTGVVQLPKLGETRFIKSQQIKGTIKNVTISKTAGQWYISFNCDGVLVDTTLASGPTIGIDRGIKIFAKVSDNTEVISPQPLKKRLNTLAKIQRKLSRKKKFSRNWNKQKTRLARFHHHIANIRSDALHKSSTEIAKNHGTIILEDLKTANMSKSAKGTKENPGKNVKAKAGLNRSILDQGWYMFFLMLVYKASWYGSTIRLVKPHYTSQKCSVCGHISAENRISQELFCCQRCAHTENADLNAAKNILAAGLAVTACGEDPLGSPMKQEPENRNVPVTTDA